MAFSDGISIISRTVTVGLPQLQDREEDIRALFRYFWAQAVASSKKTLTVADEHEVARVVALAESGSIVSRDAFLPKQRAKSAARLLQDRERRAEAVAERDAILRALRAHQGNKAEAARSLGNMKRTTLIYKIQTHRIRPEEYLVKE